MRPKPVEPVDGYTLSQRLAECDTAAERSEVVAEMVERVAAEGITKGR